MSKTRVVVADDQNISRGFFEMYVRASSNYELAAGLRTAQAAIDYVDKNEADLVIMDVMMQEGIDGLSAAAKIKQSHPEIKVILTTSTSETSWEQKAKDAGIESFWYKEYDEHGLMEIMDRTMNGESVYPEDAPKVPFGKITRDDLTDREIEIIRELTASKTNEEIADMLKQIAGLKSWISGLEAYALEKALEGQETAAAEENISADPTTEGGI